MTYRELIMYVLENHLEDEEIFKDGRFAGFMTKIEAAIKFDVDVATINVWIETGCLEAINPFGSSSICYIPANAENPKEKIKRDKVNNK